MQHRLRYHPFMRLRFACRILPGLAVALALLLLAGCSGDDDPPATATAASGAPGSSTTSTPIGATATAAASATPIPGCPMAQDACALARYLNDALAARDVQRVERAVAFRNFTCPGGQPLGPGGPYPLCEDLPAGAQRMGAGIARRYSEGAVVSNLDYNRILTQVLEAVDPAASDAFGTGALRLYGLSCVDPAADPATCPRFVVIFSAILRQAMIPPLGIVPGREVLAFFADSVPPGGAGNAAITETWMGIVQPGEGAILFQQGGTLFDLGRIVPYRLP